MTDKIIHIDALEVARKFGYLIAGKGKFSGLEFAKRIIHCDKYCKSHRETFASSVRPRGCRPPTVVQRHGGHK